MAASPITYPPAFAPIAANGHRLDPVRARVTVSQQLTNDQILQADAAAHPAADLLRLPPDTRGGGPRGPHPGDILYWVACIGGVGLLLMAATT
ncbi:MAG: hypothetical protein ABSG84_06155 [Acidobacteriaceae bacterium]